jgi:hypothetical protein
MEDPPIYLQNLIKIAEYAEGIEKTRSVCSSSKRPHSPLQFPSCGINTQRLQQSDYQGSSGSWVSENSKRCASSATTEHSQLGCGFCKQNGETFQVFTSHQLKDANGRVLCPYLWKHHCEHCGATGDFAHTRSYCPLAKVVRKINPYASYKFHNSAELKYIGHNSSGQRVRKENTAATARVRIRQPM